MGGDGPPVLLEADAIAERVRELGAELARDYAERSPVTLVPVLTGSLIFAADLVRALPLGMRIRLVSASSYQGGREARQAPAPGLLDLPERLDGAHVLIVDDILDSGATLKRVREWVRARGPASVRACVLLRKDRARDAEAEYVAFDIPNRFVVGYGLDYDGYYRNLPRIVALEPEAAS